MKSAVMITEEQRRLYREEGYMFLEKAIPRSIWTCSGRNAPPGRNGCRRLSNGGVPRGGAIQMAGHIALKKYATLLNEISAR